MFEIRKKKWRIGAFRIFSLSGTILSLVFYIMNSVEQDLIQDLGEADILQSSDLPNFALKTKTKPKRTINISEAEKKRRGDQLREVVKKRTDDSILRKEEETLRKEEEAIIKLQKIEETKARIEETKAKRAAAKSAAKPAEKKEEPKPDPEPKDEHFLSKGVMPKKAKKQVKVIVEQSSSDSEDYSDSDSSSSEEEVIYVSKSKRQPKQPKEQPKEQPITKPKHEPEVPKVMPTQIFKFI